MSTIFGIYKSFKSKDGFSSQYAFTAGRNLESRNFCKNGGVVGSNQNPLLIKGI